MIQLMQHLNERLRALAVDEQDDSEYVEYVIEMITDIPTAHGILKGGSQ